MIEFLKTSFLSPFSCPSRMTTYGFSALAVMGLAFLDLYLPFFFAGQGFGALLSYAAIRTIVANVTLFPALAWLMHKTPNKHIRKVFSVIQITAFFILYTLHASVGLHGWVIGLLFPFINVPYWMAFHSMMAVYTSDDNRGNEVAIGANITSMGSMIGVLTAGFVLNFIDGTDFILMALLPVIGSTYMFTARFSCHKKSDEKMLDLFKQKSFKAEFLQSPARLFCAMLNGAKVYMTDVMMPAWIHVMGFGAMVAAGLKALTILFRLILSPLTGHFIRQDRGNELKTGGAMILAGWLPLVFSIHPFSFYWASLLRAGGQHIHSSGEISRWYKSRNIYSIAAREMALGTGRLITSLIMVPVIFYAPNLFVLGGVALGVLMIANGFQFGAIKELKKASS